MMFHGFFHGFYYVFHSFCHLSPGFPLVFPQKPHPSPGPRGPCRICRRLIPGAKLTAADTYRGPVSMLRRAFEATESLGSLTVVLAAPRQQWERLVMYDIYIYYIHCIYIYIIYTLYIYIYYIYICIIYYMVIS